LFALIASLLQPATTMFHYSLTGVGCCVICFFGCIVNAQQSNAPFGIDAPSSVPEGSSAPSQESEDFWEKLGLAYYHPHRTWDHFRIRSIGS
jgi:hypothetical protein